VCFAVKSPPVRLAGASQKRVHVRLGSVAVVSGS
jgi:hypothetical protein